ncbi:MULTISPECIES: hypothetical protein, partial [Cytobacillus]
MMNLTKNLLNTSTLKINGEEVHYYSLNTLEKMGITDVSRLPYSMKILLEGVMRNLDDHIITEDHVKL